MKTQTVAIDLGPHRSGVAFLDRGHKTVRGYRYAVDYVSTCTLMNHEVVQVLEAVTPRLVLIEKAAEGYRQKEALKALTLVTDAIDGRKTLLCAAPFATWATEAFGFHRVNKQTQEDVAMRRLTALCGPEDAERVWAETEGQRDARSALVLLACWEPKRWILSRGRSGPETRISKQTRQRAGLGKVPKRDRGGAAQLYEVLWTCAENGYRAGQDLQCRAAHISTKSWQHYLRALSEADIIEIDHAAPAYTRILRITL